MSRFTSFALLFVIALGAALIVLNLPSLIGGDGERKGEQKVVLVAKKAIEAGTTLSEKDIETEEIPEDNVFKGILLEEDKKDVIGKLVIAPISKGEPLSRQRFNLDREYNYERIFTLDLRSLEGNLPAFRQGMHLDFILTRKERSDNAAQSAKLLENVPVVNLQYDKNKVLKSVGIGLSERQTFTLTSGMSMGRIHVVERGLRVANPTDGSDVSLFKKKAVKNDIREVKITYGTEIASSPTIRSSFARGSRTR